LPRAPSAGYASGRHYGVGFAMTVNIKNLIKNTALQNPQSALLTAPLKKEPIRNCYLLLVNCNLIFNIVILLHKKHLTIIFFRAKINLQLNIFKLLMKM